MNTWKLDWQHVVLVVAFFSGLAWYVLGHLAGQSLTLSAVMPVALVALTAALGFFKSPPGSPAEAVAAGAGGASLAAKRGATSVRAVVMTLVLGLVCLIGAPTAVTACHETPQAAVAQAIDLTNAVCSIAPESPVGQPWVTLVCQVAEGTEGVVSVVVNALDSDSGSTDAAPVATTLAVRTVRIKVSAADAPMFLAAHKGLSVDGGAQ